MLGWGGENIDLSLRIWRCGGSIKVVRTTTVGHMWRNVSDSRTWASYYVTKGNVIRNRAIAAHAHFGQRWEHLTSLSEFREFKNSPPDTGKVESAMRNLKCRSFDWYIEEFKVDDVANSNPN